MIVVEQERDENEASSGSSIRIDLFLIERIVSKSKEEWINSINHAANKTTYVYNVGVRMTGFASNQCDRITTCDTKVPGTRYWYCTRSFAMVTVGRLT